MSEALSNIAASNELTPGSSKAPVNGTIVVPSENHLPSDIREKGNQTLPSVEPKIRKKRSDVWEDFELVLLGDGSRRAICLHCKQSFDGSSKKGTTHLKNHKRTCARRPQNHLGQKLLSTINTANKHPKLGTWKFDAEITRSAFAKMIAKHDYSFNMTEHEYFQEFVKSINPTLKLYSRNTVRADVLKVYNEMKSELQTVFDQLSSRVSLTTDLWTAEHQNKGYCCVTCHYIDDDWVLHKKIIAYHMFPPPHTGILLSEFIKSTTLLWNIDNKLFAIAVDNASSNDVMIRNLIEWLNDKESLVLNGDLFHMRCSAHILNLIVQDGLKVVGPLLAKIRDSVTFCKSSQSRKQKFENALAHTKLVGKGVSSDVSTRWNSTFLMLESALEVRLAFVRLKELAPDYTNLPTPAEWQEGQVICDCLRVFYETTLQFSMVKYPTANLYFKGVSDVYSSILDWTSSEHDFVSDMANKMKDKFEKYWSTCSLMMSIGAIFDPRYKLEFVQFAFKELYGNYSITHIDKIRMSLNELYSSYEVHSSLSMDTSSNSTSGGLDSSRSSSATVGNVSSGSRMEKKFQSLRKQKLSSSKQVPKTELEKYLEEELVPIGEDARSYDVLSWWKTNAHTYPTLAIMARDILAVPVSTVASESAFSCGGRVITEYRSLLAPDVVEALCCLKDWLPSLKNADMVDVTKVVDC